MKMKKMVHTESEEAARKAAIHLYDAREALRSFIESMPKSEDYPDMPVDEVHRNRVLINRMSEIVRELSDIEEAAFTDYFKTGLRGKAQRKRDKKRNAEKEKELEC